MPRRYLWLAGTIAAILLGGVVAVAVLAGGGTDPTDLNARGPATAGPSARATSSGSPSPSVSASAVDLPIVVPAPAAPPFQPITREAEAGMPHVKLRSASVVELAGASGGRAVRFTADSGSIEFRQLSLPSAGTYRVTVFYASAGGWTGQLRSAAGTVPVAFSAGTGCCAAATLDLPLNSTGSLYLELSTGDGERPAIDRIVINRP